MELNEQDDDLSSQGSLTHLQRATAEQAGVTQQAHVFTEPPSQWTATKRPQLTPVETLLALN